MRLPGRPFRLALLLIAAAALSGCDTTEERVEAHYQRGMELLAAGDTDRAVVEFRNVLHLDDAHVATLLEVARINQERGAVEEALGHYLRVVDVDRANVEGHREVAELALAVQDFEMAEDHARRAFVLAPGDPAVRALKATVDYRGGDQAARAAALEMARGVIAETPDSVPAHMVLIADRVNADENQAALALIETALAAAPEDEGLHLARLVTLERLGDDDAIGAQLARMSGLFPENDGVRRALVQWHLGAGDTAAAEALLRDMAARDPEEPAGALTVVQFLLEVEGPDAARAELDRLIAARADPMPFRRARASLDFAEGRSDAAIAALRALADGAEPSDTIREVQLTLARMLDATGDPEGRDALIATVLEGDPGDVEALKLRARALIAADRPDAAIQDMRAALGQAPRDPEIMTIMAAAHEREGSRELMGERLALAVETSDYGAEEALRYARFLLEDGRTGPAESVIADALRRVPQDRDLLLALGEIHLERRDWARVGQVAELLRSQDDPVAGEMAARLTMAGLRAQDRLDETITMLQDLAAADGGSAAMVDLVRAQVAAGDLDAAQTYLDGILAEDPASLPGRMMQAGLHAVRGEPEAAEALYRAVIEAAPALPQPHQALVTLLAGVGRTGEARDALETGIAATGGDGELLFTKAGLLEATDDFDGAIAIYRELYDRDSSNPVIANNLASLITTHRSDAADLQQAFAIARRLRGSDVPHFQDTYGWILHRRGDPEAALAYLEPAARALGDNALAQFHLGEAQFALGRWDAARASFERTVALGDAALPEAAASRDRIAEIDARPATTEPVVVTPEG